MKKIVKLWFKNIKNSLSQFIAVIVIIFFGVAFLSGFLASNPNIKKSMNDYLKNADTWDIKVSSPLGYKNEDIEKIKKISGVKGVRYGREIDLWVEDREKNKAEARIFFYDADGYNKTELIEGRMAKSDGECVVEIASPYGSKLKIGEEIKVKGRSEKIYKIVGKVISPNFTSAHGEVTQLGIGKAYLGVHLAESQRKHLVESLSVREKIIKKSNGFGQYNILHVQIEKSRMSIFSEKYSDKVHRIKGRIEKIGEASLRKVENNLGNSFNSNKISWNVSSLEDGIGISNFKTDIKKIESIAKVFPVFFFLVAFLVVTTTMTRMIDDHRKEMGILRCLGYSKGSIFTFYLTYGLFAGIIGIIAGIPVGFSLFPKFIIKAYASTYNLISEKTVFFWDIAVIVSVVAIIVIFITVTVVVRKTLHEIPARLLLQKTPEAGKRILLERIGFVWKRLKFSRKVTFRNIFRYKKRFIMTVFGVAGCMALLIAAFGLRDSIKNILDIQYKQISRYDVTAVTADGTWKKQNHDQYEDLPLHMKKANVTTKTKNYVDSGDDVLTLNVVDSTKDIEKYIVFKDGETKKRMQLDDKGIFLSKKIAEIFNVKKGDFIKLDIGNKEKQFKVSGIFEYYTGHQGFMTKKYYRKISGKTLANNSAFIKIKEKVYDGLSINERRQATQNIVEDIKKIDGVSYVSSLDDIKESFSKSVNNINGIIAVLSICAGLLTFIILYCMSNINVLERQKELSTIKVLGLYRQEIRGYIFREINIISAIGIIFGIPLGFWLHKFVIKKIENGGVMFVRNFSNTTYVYAILITVSFVILTNLVMARKINKIDMVSAMKAND